MSSSVETVLVLDDDAAVRSALKFALELDGFHVQLYEGSQELLADPNLPECACLVIDYRMPGLNGIELVAKLKQRGLTLPVILISGRVTSQLRQLAATHGIVRVLEKPLSDSALGENIRQALEARCSFWSS